MIYYAQEVDIMNLKECLRKMIDDNNSSFARLADRLGYKSCSSIVEISRRSDTKVSILINLCNELDYDIIIRPRGGNDRAERTVVLDEVPDRKDNRGKYER